MANPRGNPNPGLARKGKKLPILTCVNCGKTKRSTLFPKRSGPYYDHLKATDPRKYDVQCKLCNKPTVPGQDRSELKEPVKRYKKRKKKLRVKRTKEVAKLLKAQCRIDTRVKSMIYLSKKGCCKCGEHDPRKLEYDHKDPSDKSRAVSRLIIDGYSWASDILRTEIRKCRVLCANCHRVHTIKQQGYYASAEVIETLRDIGAKYGFKP